MAKERKEVSTKVPSTQCCATAQNTFLQKKNSSEHLATQQVAQQLQINNAGQLVDPDSTCRAFGNREMFFSHYDTNSQVTLL